MFTNYFQISRINHKESFQAVSHSFQVQFTVAGNAELYACIDKLRIHLGLRYKNYYNKLGLYDQNYGNHYFRLFTSRKMVKPTTTIQIDWN